MLRGPSNGEVETDWVTIASLPPWIERLKATFASDDELGNRKEIYGIDRLNDSKWIGECFRHEQTVPYTLEGQEGLVNKFCRVADWIVIALPNTRGLAYHDELATVIQFIETSYRTWTDDRSQPMRIDLVLGKTVSPKEIDDAATNVFGVCNEEQKKWRNARVHIRLFQDERLLDRVILGGVTKNTNESSEKRIIRFGLQPGHVADRKEKSPSRKAGHGFWTLLDRSSQAESLERWNAFFDSNTPHSIGLLFLSRNATGCCSLG